MKILRIYRDVIRDKFQYNLAELIENTQSLLITTRSVLKLFAKIFDPIGLLTLFTINMRILFQILCIEKVTWDESLEGEVLVKLKSFINNLNTLNAQMLCQSSHDRVSHVLVSNSWVFRCFQKSVHSSCVLENRSQQW